MEKRKLVKKSTKDRNNDELTGRVINKVNQHLKNYDQAVDWNKKLKEKGIKESEVRVRTKGADNVLRKQAKKYKSGGQVCRGMGAASRGGSFCKNG